MHLLDLLAYGAGLDRGHVFCLVNDVLVHDWPPGLHSWIHGRRTEVREREKEEMQHKLIKRKRGVSCKYKCNTNAG